MWASILFLTIAGAQAAEFGNVLLYPCGGEHFEPCAGVLSELRSEISQKVLQPAIQDAYEGRIHVNGRDDVEEKLYAAETLSERPLCTLQPLPSTGCVSERERNRRGESCGSLAKLHYVKPPQYVFTLPVTRGQRETAWVAGAFLSALQESALQVNEEISVNRLSVDTGSACHGAARDWFSLLEKVKAHPIISTLKGCRDKGLVSCTSRDQVVATLASLRAAYLQVARCFIFESAMRKQRELSRDFHQRITRGVVDACVRTCGNDAACLPRCYTSRVTRWFEEELQSRFPLTSAGCSEKGAS